VSERVCWNCAARLADGHFCLSCGKIQPLAAGEDYFSFFGLPRKLSINLEELEEVFYALSRKFHPDFFFNSSDYEKQISMDKSSTLNDAYRTLRDPIRRTQYLLELEGAKTEEGKDKLAADLLEEVFELNLELEELKAAKKLGDEDEIKEITASVAASRQKLEEKIKELEGELQGSLFAKWDALLEREATDREQREKLLARMNCLLSHLSYLRNLVRDIKEEVQ